jgi:hypothetical protein
MGVCIDADQRLEQRSGDLERSRDHADLTEVQMIGGFQDRIDGGHDRLHHVIKKVAETDGSKDAKRSCPGVGGGARRKGGRGHSFCIVMLTRGSLKPKALCHHVLVGGEAMETGQQFDT